MVSREEEYARGLSSSPFVDGFFENEVPIDRWRTKFGRDVQKTGLGSTVVYHSHSGRYFALANAQEKCS